MLKKNFTLLQHLIVILYAIFKMKKTKNILLYMQENTEYMKVMPFEIGHFHHIQIFLDALAVH